MEKNHMFAVNKIKYQMELHLIFNQKLDLQLKTNQKQKYIEEMSAYKAAYPPNNENFITLSKQIQFGNLQPSLMQNIVKLELQKNRLSYSYPASVGNAMIHRDAYKFGYTPPRRGQPPRVCPCCLERVETEQIGICYHTTKVQLQELGDTQFKLKPGIALFFSFIKMLIVYLIFRFIICDAFNLLTNIIGGAYCQDESQKQCTYTLSNFLSIYNKKKNTQYIFIQDILCLVLIVLSIAYFFLYRKKQYSMTKLLNQKNQVQQDFTIMVENIPLIDFPSISQSKKMRVNQRQTMELFHRQHLQKFFQSKINAWTAHRNKWNISSGTNEGDLLNLLKKNNGQFRSPQIVKSISLCYNLQRLQTLQNQRDQLIRNRKKYEELRSQGQSYGRESTAGIQELQQDHRFSSVPKQIQFLNDCEVILNKQYASDNSVLFNITNFVGKAFISFQYQHYREYILEQAQRNMNFLLFNGSRLKVTRVSNPKDINWMNLRYSVQKQKKKNFSTIVVLLLIVGLCLGLLCATQWGKSYAEQGLTYSGESLVLKLGHYFLLGLPVVIIIGINKLIVLVTKQKTKQQCHYSKSRESFSAIKKIVFFQFICSGVLPYVVSRIFNSYFGSAHGLIEEITIYIIVSGTVMNALSLISPRAILRALLLKCRYGNLTAEDTVDKFQIQLNRQYQYIEFDIINEYVNFLNLVYTAFFYSYMIPATIPVLVVVLFFQFWIDKINLFKRSSHPRIFSFFLTRNILKIFQASIWIFALGVVLFGIYIHDSLINGLNLAGLAIASLYLWFLIGASRKLQRSLFGNYETSQSSIYDDCVADGKFEQTYWTSNPATCLVKETDLTGKQYILNPGLKKVFVNYLQNQQ